MDEVTKIIDKTNRNRSVNIVSDFDVLNIDAKRIILMSVVCVNTIAKYLCEKNDKRQSIKFIDLAKCTLSKITTHLCTYKI